MKRIVSALLVCMLLVGCALAFTSCGGPSGTYEDKFGATTLTFKGKEVTITVAGWSTTASFEIAEEDGDKTITFTYGDDDQANPSFNGTFAYSEGTEDGEDYIKIGIFTYVKTK